MAEIWIWNSIATRRRSVSDHFLENGLAILKSHLENKGHKVRIIDWANKDFYEKLSPKILILLNRFFTKALFKLNKGKKEKKLKIFFPFFYLFQEILNLFQKKRMRIFLKKLAKEVLDNQIKVIGVKVWYGEAFFWSKILVKYLKKLNPSILTIAGGYHPTLYREDFLEHSPFDLAITGEGEKPLEMVMEIIDKNLRNWDIKKVLKEIREKGISGELKNLVFRENGKIKYTPNFPSQIKSKPIPKYGDISGKVKIHVLLDSLGCPWGKCNFCVHSYFYPTFHPRPVKDIINEIKFMVDRGIRLFRFAGSETPPAFGSKIAKSLMEENIQILYSIGCRAIKGAREKERYEWLVKKFEIMLQAGLVAIFMGGETGHDLINDHVMNKGINYEDIIYTNKAYKEAQRNIGKKAYLTLALIYPTPLISGVSQEDVFKENIRFIEGLSPDSVIITPPGPFKHTRWYNEKERFGFEINSGNGFIKKAMEYEYVLYKPVKFWPELEIGLNGKNFKKILSECQEMRKAVEEMGIATDVVDEFFLMMRASGLEPNPENIRRFKENTLIDLISSDYRYINELSEKINHFKI